MKVKRFDCNPIIHLNLSPSLNGNVNGPSLIEAPSWLPDPLGKYYLYFAHHAGSFIRLAYSDHLEGPWNIYEPGTLQIEQSHCYNHVASPDVHVDDDKQEIRMYYHGWVADSVQKSKVAVSRDGINFEASPESLGQPYFRVFQWQGYHYAVGMPGVFYRSKDGLTAFEEGPTLFPRNMRHTALDLQGNSLKIYYTNAADSPERIFLSTIDIGANWTQWKASEPELVLEPETEYEGAELPATPSSRGLVLEKVRQLRDPGIFKEGGDTYILYSIAGEQGIAIARIES